MQCARSARIPSDESGSHPNWGTDLICSHNIATVLSRVMCGAGIAWSKLRLILLERWGTGIAERQGSKDAAMALKRLTKTDS